MERAKPAIHYIPFPLRLLLPLIIVIPFPLIIIPPFPGDFVSKHPVGAAVFVVLRIFMPFPPFPGDLVLRLKQNVGALESDGCAEGVVLGLELGLLLGSEEGA